MDRIFADSRFADLATAHRANYASAAPFAHAVIDDFLPRDVAERVLGEFPDPKSADWHRYDNPRERKLASREDEHFGAYTRGLFHEFNAIDFLRFLEALTGIENLLPDPHFEGGGLHQIQRGGHINIHADFNRHPLYDLDRRLNVLIYLNKDWEDAWNGHLELWDEDMSSCRKKIAPVFNRAVVFSTTDHAFHGHPVALACPPEVTRKSMALYYYTNGRPAAERFGTHTTLFRLRPEDVPAPAAWALTKARCRVADALRKLAHYAEPDRV